MRQRIRRLAALAATALVALGLAVTVAAPAQAATAFTGYVWAYNPTAASYTPPVGFYNYSSTGIPIRIDHPSTGVYLVHFFGMGVGSGLGVAHATAYGSGPEYCHLGKQTTDGATDLIAEVWCHKADGSMVDTYFVANFEYRIATTAGVVDYLDADQPLTAWYHPTNFYDSNGWTPSVQRNGVGRYTVYVPSMINGIGPLSYQITSWGMDANRCKIMSYPTANGAMNIWCHDQWGSSKDEHFHLTVTHKTNPMGEYAPPFGYARIRLGGTAVLDSYSTAGPAATVTAVGVGVYDVTWPSLSVSYGHAVAYAIGSSAEQCHVNWWGPNTVRLVCYKFTAPADQEVAVALSS